MVHIDVLESNPWESFSKPVTIPKPNADVMKFKNFLPTSTMSIYSLARNCAAGIIQARWRGFRFRSERISLLNKQQTKSSDDIHHHSICSRELFETVGTQTTMVYCTNDHDASGIRMNYTTTNTVRKRFISNIHSSRTSEIEEINITEDDLLKQLKKMELISTREYDLLVSRIKNASTDHHPSGKNKFYQLRLVGPVQEFENQFITAWLSITLRSHSIHTIEFRKQIRLRFQPYISKIRECFASFTSIPEETLSLLTKNSGVVTYKADLISYVLNSLGAKSESIGDTPSSTSLSDSIKEAIHSCNSSLLRNRLEIALKVVQDISLWEESTHADPYETSSSVSVEEAKFPQNDEVKNQYTVDNLLRVISSLRIKIDDLEKKKFCKCCRDENYQTKRIEVLTNKYKACDLDRKYKEDDKSKKVVCTTSKLDRFKSTRPYTAPVVYEPNDTSSAKVRDRRPQRKVSKIDIKFEAEYQNRKQNEDDFMNKAGITNKINLNHHVVDMSKHHRPGDSTPIDPLKRYFRKKIEKRSNLGKFK